jgi:hypothetical protein
MRRPVLDGWDGHALGAAFSAIVAMGTLTMTLVFGPLRSRTA